METHTCKVYFSVDFKIDFQKNAALIREGLDCTPEAIGIYNKAEAEAFLKDRLGVRPVWNRHHFEIGINERYDNDINEMIRVTLKDLLGKEETIRQMQQSLGVTTSLVLVPHIQSDCPEPCQNLSPGQDIIDFLYRSHTELDMDYYVY